MRLMSTKKTNERIKARTAQIKVGETYFLSSFYDKAGAMVVVQNKSTKKNRAGWPSSVEVKVIESVGDGPGLSHYKPGGIHTVNATNLYEKREMAGR